MVIVFDLDGTLYDELTYVQSGFRAVAGYLEDTHRISTTSSFSFMMQKLSGGRGRIFDDLLTEFGVYSKKNVQKCLSVYHCHRPEIRLSGEADACLERFAKFPLYVVTDGNKLVQENKLRALGVPPRVKFCYITHRYGIKNAKPSPYCFLKICEREKVDPKEVFYIADNPNKDFVGIKPLGFKTIRILQGSYREILLTSEYEAENQIRSLNELTEELIEELTVNS